MGKWTTISLPKRLTGDIKQFAEEVGYWNSVSAFVREATIEKLNRERARLRAAGEEEPDLESIQAYIKPIVDELHKRRTEG
ncbi:hypothetical protein CEE36_11385 [candidate division TA06 bacterium B3_TA06]|uniref:CopG family transcriptional regulator n=1 Tax=candidate division TA06 bacterium B3_TA06 TaxID=2012487 RepID=A0A532UPQ8_UNCT6|nr:MAG: hypothetical protein CEE36_11385 [candidate division TA06 bacterium B3_TA06]